MGVEKVGKLAFMYRQMSQKWWSCFVKTFVSDVIFNIFNIIYTFYSILSVFNG